MALDLGIRTSLRMCLCFALFEVLLQAGCPAGVGRGAGCVCVGDWHFMGLGVTSCKF